MGYGAKIYQQAREELERRRSKAEAQAARRREDFYRRCPGPGKSNRRWPRTPPTIARAVLAGENARAAMERLRDRDQTLRQEYQACSRKRGSPPRTWSPGTPAPAAGTQALWTASCAAASGSSSGPWPTRS